MGDAAPRALLLSIGSELLRGETVDTNAAHLAGELSRLGFRVLGVRQLPDEQATIARAFREARAASDLVVATGGLGPTHDDLTRDGLADALGEALRPDPTLEEMLRARFSSYGAMPESNLRQALLVPSAEPLPNPIGSAPGWWVDGGAGVTILLPGVPSEMRKMWADEVVNRLARRFSVRPPASRTLKTIGIGESAVAERLGGLLEAPGDGIEAGIYARDDGVHVRFSTPGDAALLDAPAERAGELMAGDMWGRDGDDLATVVLAALGRRGVGTLASWEADTAGALLAVLAEAHEAAGSARFVGGALDTGGGGAGPVGDVVLQVWLLAQDAHGRSRVRVALSGSLAMAQREVRIHGSGSQRLRRAAFAALDQVRRAVDALD